MDLALLKQIALGTVPPLCTACLAFLLLWRRGLDDRTAAWRRAAGPALLAIFYVGTHLLAFGAPEWPVRRALHTLIAAALLSGAAGVLIASRRVPLVWVLVLGACVAGLGGWLSVRGVIANWSLGRAVLALGLVALSGGVNVLAAEYLIRRVGGRAGPVAVLVGVAGAAQVLATGFFSLALGQAAGVGAALLVGAVGASIPKSGRPLWDGVAIVPVLVATVCVFQGVVGAGDDAPLLLCALCAAALPVGAITLRCLPREWSGVRTAACVMLAIVAPMGTAVVLGALAWLSANNDY